MHVFATIMSVLLICCIVGILWSIFMLIKTTNTYKKRIIIINAIAAYMQHCINLRVYDYAVTYDDMEDYDSTDYRIWDWGYTRILPPDKFKIIEPFIKEN